MLCVFFVTHLSSAALPGDTACGLHGRGLSLVGNSVQEPQLPKPYAGEVAGSAVCFL